MISQPHSYWHWFWRAEWLVLLYAIAVVGVYTLIFFYASFNTLLMTLQYLWSIMVFGGLLFLLEAFLAWRHFRREQKHFSWRR